MAIRLEPNGFVSGTDKYGLATIKEIEECPWFWSRKRKSWIYRPEYRGYKFSGNCSHDVQRLIEQNGD